VFLSQLEYDVDDLCNLNQSLQIRLGNLSAQETTIFEIFIQHRQMLQRIRDECNALRGQLEDLQVRPHQGQASSSAISCSDAVSFLVVKFIVPDLNSPIPRSAMEASGM
jgi:hypothetical protein